MERETATPASQQANATAGRIRPFSADGASSSALYVGDLDKSVDEGLLYHLFSRVRLLLDFCVSRPLLQGFWPPCPLFFIVLLALCRSGL